jgi:hypothetical protein
LDQLAWSGEMSESFSFEISLISLSEQSDSALMIDAQRGPFAWHACRNGGWLVVQGAGVDGPARETELNFLVATVRICLLMMHAVWDG